MHCMLLDILQIIIRRVVFSLKRKRFLIKKENTRIDRKYINPPYY